MEADLKLLAVNQTAVGTDPAGGQFRELLLKLTNLIGRQMQDLLGSLLNRLGRCFLDRSRFLVFRGDIARQYFYGVAFGAADQNGIILFAALGTNPVFTVHFGRRNNFLYNGGLAFLGDPGIGIRFTSGIGAIFRALLVCCLILVMFHNSENNPDQGQNSGADGNI